MERNITPLKSLRNKRSEKEERKRKQNDVIAVRKEKRLFIVNTRRRINDEWNQFDYDECDSVSFAVLSLNDLNTHEMQIRLIIEQTNTLLIDSRNYQSLNDPQFFHSLSSLITDPTISMSLKLDIFCLIEKIFDDIQDINAYVIINSEIILAILSNFDNKLEIATKAIKIMLTILDGNDDLISYSLANGYIDYIDKLINSGNQPKLKHRKNSDISILSNTPKANLYQQLAKSVNFLMISNHLLQLSHIKTLLSISLILLGFPAHYQIHSDILSAIEFFAKFNVELVFNDTNNILIRKIVDLLTNKDENTVINAITIFCNGKQFVSNILLNSILSKMEILITKHKQSGRVIKQVIYFLSVFVENSDALQLLIGNRMIPFLFQVMKNDDYNQQKQAFHLSSQIVYVSNFSQLMYLIENGLIESLTFIFCISLSLEEHITANTLLAMCIKLLSESEKYGQLETLKQRMQVLGINKYVNTLKNHTDIEITNKVRVIMNRYLTRDEECSTNISAANYFFDTNQTPLLST